MTKKSDTNQIKDWEKEIDSEYQKYIETFSSLDDKISNIDEKIEEINSIIMLANNRIYYTEDRLSKIATFSVALMGIGMAFFAGIIHLNGWAFFIGLITAVSFVLTGGITSLINSSYMNPKYPFRAMKGDWKWFYSGIIDTAYHPKPVFQDNQSEFFKKRLLHMQGLNDYAQKLLTENKSERLKVDLQQLYLLHLNEKYKTRYLSNLRSILIRGIVITSIFLFILVGLITCEKMTKVNVKNNGNNVAHEVTPIKK